MYQLFEFAAPFILIIAGIMELKLAIMEYKSEKEKKEKEEAQKESAEIREKWKGIL